MVITADEKANNPNINNKHRFSQQEINGVYRAIETRRDIRHFIPGDIAPELLHKLIIAAQHAPSVGYMQPWHFIRITDTNLRKAIHQHVELERLTTAGVLGERKDEFMKLKIEGILQCSELLVVSLIHQREKYVLGRRTMPEMDLASVACAIQNMWLAARAEGIGLGWVSFFEPNELARLLKAPEGARPVAILCIGHAEEFTAKPLLETSGWDKRRDLSSFFSENTW